jgi:Iron-containing redox enzyme
MLDVLAHQARLLASMSSAPSPERSRQPHMSGSDVSLEQATYQWTRNIRSAELLLTHQFLFGYCDYFSAGSGRYVDDFTTQSKLHATANAICTGWFKADLQDYRIDSNASDSLPQIDRAVAASETHASWIQDYIENRAGVEELKHILVEDSALGQRYPRIVEASIPIGIEVVRHPLTTIYLEEIGYSDEIPHAPLQRELLATLHLPCRDPRDWANWRPLAGLNLLLLLALNTRQYPRFIGALYAGEAADGKRAGSVHLGLRRTGLADADPHSYYALHHSADVGHADQMKQQVLAPLIAAERRLANQVLEGVLLWATASTRYDEHLRDTMPAQKG